MTIGLDIAMTRRKGQWPDILLMDSKDVTVSVENLNRSRGIDVFDVDSLEVGALDSGSAHCREVQMAEHA